MDRREELLREFARCENIAAFTRQLATETDSARRKLLQALLLEQEALAPNRPAIILTP